MKREANITVEWAQFHWEKWREEANRFWKYLALGTIGLVALCLFELDILQFQFSNAKFSPNVNSPLVKRFLVCPFSIWLWISIAFGLVDFLRHRVPDQMEKLMHNNRFPVPWGKARLDLRLLARSLYVAMILLYLSILAFWVVYCSIHAWR